MLKHVYVETYGCRMNLLDSEILLRLLSEADYSYTSDISEAEIVIINGCSVREAGHKLAEQRLKEIEKLIRADAVLCLTGCMATQVKRDFFDRFSRVQILAAPTSYHSLANAIREIQEQKERHIELLNTFPHEVYDHVLPVRKLEDHVTAAITVMKGCDRFCSYCIEPFSRGERTNRTYEGIMREAQSICEEGYKEITLFGHIVDVWEGKRNGQTIGFAELLDDIAGCCSSQRIKFISSHPLTLSDKIASVIAKHENIMRVVHFPVQSGSNDILRKMNRGYTVEEVLKRMKSLRAIVPDLQFISDVLVGFPTETEEQFEMTLRMLEEAQFADINCFAFSMREGTIAHRLYTDDVPNEAKQSRLRRAEELNTRLRAEQSKALIHTEVDIIIEQQQADGWYGRDKWHRNIFVRTDSPMQAGDTRKVRISGYKNNHLYSEKI